MVFIQFVHNTRFLFHKMALFRVISILLASVINLRGEEVTIKIGYDFRDENRDCFLPSAFCVKLENPYLKIAPEIDLVKRDVIGTNHDKIFKRGVAFSENVLEAQGYSNATVGAAFLVSCVVSDSGQSYLKMEGSFHLRGLKFRLSPMTSLEDGSIIFTPQHVALRYSMTPVREPSFADAKGIRVPGSDVKFTSVSRLGSHKEVTSDFSTPHQYRHRRATQDYSIDILPVVDFSLYSRWLSVYQDPDLTASEITTYLATVLTAVDMRLQTLSLGDTKLNVRMTTPFLSTDASTSLYIEAIKVVSGSITKVSAPTLLETFDNWVTQQTTLPQHDHAILFTSYDLIPSRDPNIVTTNNTRGLAYIGTVCRDKSVSLVEDFGAYQSENVATHELGHSLGALHDGDNNACLSSDRYLMSTGTYPQSQLNALHPWLFSPCSSVDISAYLTQLESEGSLINGCLLDLTGDEVNTTRTVSAQTICENLLGDGAFPCRNYTDFSEICTDLYCRLPDTELCQQVVSATGTCCGNGKMCVAGNCTDAADGECPLNDACPLGDQPSITLNGEVTTCAQLNSSYCYIEAIQKVCCDTCQTLESGVPGCLYGDKELGCTTSECGSTFAASGLSYDFICCGTCDATGCTDRASFNVAGSDTNYDCPGLVAERGKYICYEQVVHIEFCCQECERLRDKDSDDCPYGDRANCTVVTAFSQCSTDTQALCCETCQILQEMEATTAAPTTATTLPTTETTATTVSTADTATTASAQFTTTTAATSEADVPTTFISVLTTVSTEAITSTQTTAATVTTPASTSAPTTTTIPKAQFPENEDSVELGYKPDGFQGCYLPPCSADRTVSSLFLIVFCVYLALASSW